MRRALVQVTHETIIDMFYRIIQELNWGELAYYPQYKKHLFSKWRYYIAGVGVHEYKTIEGAEKYLNDKRLSEKWQRERVRSRKVIKVYGRMKLDTIE